MRRAFFIAILLIAGAAFAKSLVPLPVQDLTAGADRIVMVKAGETRIVNVPLPGGGAIGAWETTLEVVDDLKGSWRADSQVTWRHRAPSKTIGDEGAIWLEPGQVYLLFLGPDSPATGLCAPIGEVQGVFTQTIDEEGRAFLQNENANLGLFDGLTPESIEWKDGHKATAPTLSPRIWETVKSKQGPVNQDDLLELIRALQKLPPEDT
ncbi:hypothetical protein KQI84_17340 [bacterium]|nr:hypothetical protein [bacterium]